MTEGRRKPLIASRVAFYFSRGAWPQWGVMHLCDNPPCCNPAHLRDGSQSDNLDDAASKMRTTLGERNAQAKLTDDDVRAIRAEKSRGVRSADLAARYGIHRNHVDRIAARLAWRHI